AGAHHAAQCAARKRPAGGVRSDPTRCGACGSRRSTRRSHGAAGCGNAARRCLGQKSRCARGGSCCKPTGCRRRPRSARPIERPMIRAALYLILVGAIAYGVALLADRPGDVVVTWQGLRIETSLLVLGGAVLASVVALSLLFGIIRWITRSPVILARLLRNRRGVRAYEAISHGLIAVGAGDVAAAQRFTAEVQRLAPGEPLALLLGAQAAQLGGDRDAAERAFRTMAARPDTKALGLHGLFI